MTSEPITFTLTITAKPWTPYEKDGSHVRYWNVPGNFLAAEITPKKGFWPFKKFEWAIFTPFDFDRESPEGDEFVDEETPLESNTAASLEDAMKAADEALRRHIAVLSAHGS